MQSTTAGNETLWSPLSRPKETLVKLSPSKPEPPVLEISPGRCNLTVIRSLGLEMQGACFAGEHFGNRPGRRRTGYVPALERNGKRQTTERPLLHPLLDQIRSKFPVLWGRPRTRAARSADPPSELLALGGAAAGALGTGRRPQCPCHRLQARPVPRALVCPRLSCAHNKSRHREREKGGGSAWAQFEPPYPGGGEVDRPGPERRGEKHGGPNCGPFPAPPGENPERAWDARRARSRPQA